ncbi:MAG TPA: radical SAM protein [Candidatus Acidoferrales bacterium]|jgi:MoaA/NifB/PqqE/SkfB family radical SAM enzyme|nr:radical SAM protein [Candidatus Acidoferrales bacterium]
MKNFTRKLGWHIYHFVHTNGAVADVVYWGAFYVQNFLRGRQYKHYTKHYITPEELYEHRRLTPSAYLVAGVTNICNAKCTFCAYPRVVANKTLQTGVMSLEVFKKAVDEWAALGGQSLDLTPVVGDPLVDPGILDKVDYAVNRAGLKDVYLTTNAILINRNETYKKLIDLGIAAVYISTQGASKEVYERIYGVKRYDEAMSGVRNLMEYNRSKNEPARIVVRFRNHEKPSAIIRSPDFKKYIQPYLSERVRVNFTVDFDNWGGTIKAGDMTGFMRLRELPPMLNVPCQNLFNFAVRHDGKVRLCGCRLTASDNDDLVVGNVREKTLMELSQSDETWNIVKGFYEGKRPTTCLECTFYQPINRTWLEHRAAEKLKG